MELPPSVNDPMYLKKKKTALEVVGKSGDYLVNDSRTICQLFGNTVGSSICTSHKNKSQID